MSFSWYEVEMNHGSITQVGKGRKQTRGTGQASEDKKYKHVRINRAILSQEKVPGKYLPALLQEANTPIKNSFSGTLKYEKAKQPAY